MELTLYGNLRQKGGGGLRGKENNILNIGTIFEFALLQTFNATSNNTMIFIYTVIYDINSTICNDTMTQSKRSMSIQRT